MIWNEDAARKMASLLLQINAVKLNLRQPFTWSSGWKSPIYCDNRLTLSFPEIRTFIKEQIGNIIKEIANTAWSRTPAFGSVFDPRRALRERAALAAQTYIRPGTTRPKVPHARCEGAGSEGDGTILYRGVFQPCRDPVTHRPWIS